MPNRKQQIFHQAAQLFKDRGYSAVTMRDLASALNIKAASLYNHISGKHQILSELILEIAEAFVQGMNHVMKENDTAFAKAEKLIHLHIQVAMKFPDGIAVMNNDWMHLEGSAYQRYTEMRRNYERDFRSILQDGIKNGEFKDVTIDTMLFNLLSTLRTLYLWIPKRSQKEIDQLQVELPKLLLGGMSK